MKKIISYTIALLLIFFTLAYFWLMNSNDFKREGRFKISINDKPIKIIRDNNGIAYVIAESKADAIRGQGFVTAQDRLFQIEFYRALIKGEGSSIVGNTMLKSDIEMRVLDLYGNAKKSYNYLSNTTKNTLKWYCEGFNAYLEAGKDEFPLELSLLEIKPKKLDPIDIVSVVHFIGFFHSQNMKDEILSLNLAAANPNLASKLLPLSINIDRKKPLHFTTDSLKASSQTLSLYIDDYQDNKFVSYPSFGSNNWVISSEKSKSGKPILANDPHVDSRILPGTFYPIGLICPEFKAVGIATPGVPGLLSGRNEFVSFGVTNGYGDSQDLHIETIRGNDYLQNDSYIPLKIRKEVIKVKDSTPVELSIRSTERGPIISDFPEFGIKTKNDVSLRWSLSDTKSASLGFDKMLETKNVDEFREALHAMDANFFNYVIADTDGKIAHQTTGLIPVRRNKSGEIPQIVDSLDNWLGYIPKSRMPFQINPNKQWLGTANHDTRPDDYPYFYSNHFSPYYRYKRLSEVLSEEKKFNRDDLWKLILDVKNKQAEKFSPIFIEALKQDSFTEELAQILEKWNFKDAINETGATVYNVLYNELLYIILNDELPDDLEQQYWDNVYYWNQRLDQLILTEDHQFFDNINTLNIKENLKDLIVLAGKNTKKILTQRFGNNNKNWTWGKIHTISFVSPLRTKGFGKHFLGAETLPKQGSNQTLNRGAFVKNEDHIFDTSWFSSFRMVADMSDKEKMIGVISGGSSARVFHPYYKSQLDVWKTNTWIPYWISKEKIIENSKFVLILE